MIKSYPMKRQISLILLGCLVQLGLSASPGISAASAVPGQNWGWPLDPHRIIGNFDPPAQNWLPGHRGVDLAGTSGEVVRSAGDGEVIFAGDIAGKGVVVVRHGNFRTTYEPVAPSVFIGLRVHAGDEIGKLQPGNSHCATKTKVSCLHWALIRGQTYLNPLVLVKKPVRLLPVSNSVRPADAPVQRLRVVGP